MLITIAYISQTAFRILCLSPYQSLTRYNNTTEMVTLMVRFASGCANKQIDIVRFKALLDSSSASK